MLRRAGRRLALTALCLSFAGCATVYSFPKAMGGVRTHGEMLGIGQSGNYYRGIGQTLWLIFLPISLSDLALSLGADLALLPILGPPALVETIRESRRAALVEYMREEREKDRVASQPPPPTPAQVAVAERRDAVRRAEVERARAAKETTERVLREAWQAAKGDPEEERRVSGVLDRLYGNPQTISRVEDTFIWVREERAVEGSEEARQLGWLMDAAEGRGADASGWIIAAHLAERRGDAAGAIELCNAALDRDPLQGPAWVVRGWGRLQLGDLDRAELDLELGGVLCLCAENGAWATIGRARVAEARGQRAEARLRYEQVLGEPGLVEALQRHVDHVSDVRRRVAALAHE